VEDYSIQKLVVLFGAMVVSAVFIVLFINLRTRFLLKVRNLQIKEERERNSDTLQ
jgi:hypothetical protein